MLAPDEGQALKVPTDLGNRTEDASPVMAGSVGLAHSVLDTLAASKGAPSTLNDGTSLGVRGGGAAGMLLDEPLQPERIVNAMRKATQRNLNMFTSSLGDEA